PVSDSPYQLDSAKVLRACTALKAYLEASKDPAAKPNLLDDPEAPSASAVTIWLNLTTKKYISDTRKLKPTPIPLPHSLASPTATAILIVKEPQRHYKDLVATAGLTSTITKVVDVAKLKAKFKSFESKRQLAESHDVFLADDRIVTTLPKILGKSIYKRSAQIPIPLSLAETTSPAQLTKAVRKALDSTYLHLSPAASTSVRVALSSHTPEAMAANIIAAVSVLTESKIPGGWRNIRSLHIKSPESAALPIWMAEELYSDEDVLAAGEAEAVAAAKEKEKEDRKTRKIEKRKKRKS
ncbi:ribosomal protein L1p/L10e family-domain-containing protein, partial [Geopyxis carbonaria]